MNYINPPFNYTGSKFSLLPQILPLFDRSRPCFIDLFCGGGSVFANALPLYQSVVANDRIGELIGAHEGLLALGADFVATVKQHCVAKDDQVGYHALRDKFNKERTSAQLMALMLCCTNNMMRFNRKLEFNQTFGKRTFSDATQAKCDAFIAACSPHYSSGSLKFRAGHFGSIGDVVSDWSQVMLYCDPPYEGTEAGYNAYWERNMEHELYDLLKRVDAAGGRWALSGVRGGHKDADESPVIRRLIGDGYGVTEIQHDYSKVARNKDEKRGQEVLIRNYQ